MHMEEIRFPAEWEEQSGVQLTWPTCEGQWPGCYEKTLECFAEIAGQIAKRETLLVVCRDWKKVEKCLGNSIDRKRVRFRELPSNDVWARDHGPLCVFKNGKPVLYDFTFNGWGLKFPADDDNLITRRLVEADMFESDIEYVDMTRFVLEGGSVESDGKGTILTTASCLLSSNRNDSMTRDDIEKSFREFFGVKRVLWLEHGHLAGDDTDGHVDTLARFCDDKTIAYVKCEDEKDEHFDALAAMEEELRCFRTLDGEPYHLMPLPMAEPVLDESHRLPATYANFLILNGAVLMPTYGNGKKDEEAKERLSLAFPDREIVGINCLPLITQHGSLHCVTMQYPKGFMV